MPQFVAQKEVLFQVRNGYGCRAALHHTVWLKVWFMVQAQQFRKTREDEHNATSLFRYLHAFAVQFSSVSQMVCLDDKHQMKVGFTVAVAERGQRVLVRVGSSFEVGGHHFTKFSMISQCCTSRWDYRKWDYRRHCEFLVRWRCPKDAALDPSSPMHHMTELYSTLSRQPEQHSVLLWYLMEDQTLEWPMCLSSLLLLLFSGS